MYDAILLACNELMRPQQGRKALILLTDGVDNGSRTLLSEAIESAQRADTLVYSIYFKGEEGNGGGFGRNQGPDGKPILQRISRETGGGFYEISKKIPVDQIYDHLQEELRNQYSLGFTPSRTDAGTSFRKISVTVKPKGMTVQTREGYYAR
jgi:VWFA-related protein